MSGTMKLLRNTKNKIRKDENGEKFPHPKITEIVLYITILSTMIISMIQVSCIHLFLINCLMIHWIFHQKKKNHF